MYLDLGQKPARPENRFKMNFLLYLLQEEEESLLYRMLNAHQNHPVRGYWYSGVHKIMEEMNIVLEIQEIQDMSRIQFRKIEL